MNPFRPNDTLFVHFGSVQRWPVAHATATHCALRIPGLTTPAVLWFSAEQLLAWNPRAEPKAAHGRPVYLLPAPRPVMFGTFGTRYVEMQHLSVGDILLHGPMGQRVMVCALGQVYDTHPLKGAAHFSEMVRFGVLQDLKTGRKWAHEFRNCGHGGERVIGKAAA